MDATRIVIRAAVAALATRLRAAGAGRRSDHGAENEDRSGAVDGVRRRDGDCRAISRARAAQGCNGREPMGQQLAESSGR